MGLVTILILASTAPLAQGVASETSIIFPNGGAGWAQLTPVSYGSGEYMHVSEDDIWVGINYCCSYQADERHYSDGQVSSVVGRMRDGEFVWSIHLTSNGKVATDRISVNNRGQAMVTAHFWDGPMTIQGTTYENQGGYDTFFLVLDPSGEILFHEVYGSSENDGAGFVQMTDQKEAIIVGHAGGVTSIDISRMNSSLIDFRSDEVEIDEDEGLLYANFSSKDILLRRYSIDGQLRMIRTLTGGGSDSAHGLEIRPDGSMLVSGLFAEELHFGDLTIKANQPQDYFAAKLSPEGDWVWAFAQTGSQSKSKMKGKIVEYEDNLSIAAWSFDRDIEFDGKTYSPDGGRDVAIAQLDSDGQMIGFKRLGGVGEEYLRDLSVNEQGDVALLFESTSSRVEVAGENHTGNSMAIALIIRNGTEIVWSESMDAAGQIFARDIGMSKDGLFTIGGYHSGNGDFNGTSQSTGSSTKSFVWTFMIDSDSDGVADLVDNCRWIHNPGQENLDGNGTWVRGEKGDRLGDVCDPDIDADLVENEQDSCPYGFSLFIYSHSGLDTINGEYHVYNLREDYDSDGCMNLEDRDDDNDWVHDLDDSCQHGVIGWRPNGTNDYDWDGCRDADEDDDDDSDTVLDVYDSCPYSPLGWISTPETDVNGDGCIDDWSTDDRDEDGFNDTIDFCPDEWGNSTKGSVLGCLDSDGDGWGDIIDVDPEDPDVFLPPPPEFPVPVPPPEKEDEELGMEDPPADDPLTQLSTEMLILGGMFALVMIAFSLMTLTSREDDILQRDMRPPEPDERIETISDPPY